jgi:hypothetical protein
MTQRSRKRSSEFRRYAIRNREEIFREVKEVELSARELPDTVMTEARNENDAEIAEKIERV